MNKYKIPIEVTCLLFDMDGTLVDSEPAGPITFEEHFRNYGVEPNAEEKALFVKVWRRDGTDINEEVFLRKLTEKYNITVNFDEFLTQFFELYKLNITKAPPLPGVENFLKTASENRNVRLAVVTASKRSQAMAVLDNLGWAGYFDELVCEEDISHHKPDPDGYIIGMKKLNAKLSDTIIFEDSKNGAMAGNKAGCIVIGLRVGNDKEQDLSFADVVLNSFNEVSFA